MAGNAVNGGSSSGNKYNGSLIGRPLGIQLQTVRRHGRWKLRQPACKGIAGLGRCRRCSNCSAVVLRDGIHRSAAVRVKGNGILVDIPLRIEGHSPSSLRGQVLYLCLIFIGSPLSVCLCVPAGKGVAGTGVAAFCQRRRCIIGQLQRIHGSLPAIGIKYQLVGNGLPFCSDRQSLFRHHRHGGWNFLVPAVKDIARFSGGCRCGDGGAVVLRDGIRRSAAVRIKGDGVLVDVPLCIERYISGCLVSSKIPFRVLCKVR